MTLDASRLGAWGRLGFFADGGLAGVEAALARETRPVLPEPRAVFRALEFTPPDRVRVVILGQDPYPTRGHADGLAFSVAPGVALPGSLRNIFAELAADQGRTRSDGNLADWARQGVLLLNRALTVPEGAAGGHLAGFGWEGLAAGILNSVSRRDTAFVLWGRAAQALAAHIRPGGHAIVQSPHPSPLSARRGFFGSRPFGRVNAWLAARGEAPVIWA